MSYGRKGFAPEHNQEENESDGNTSCAAVNNTRAKTIGSRPRGNAGSRCQGTRAAAHEPWKEYVA